MSLSSLLQMKIGHQRMIDAKKLEISKNHVIVKSLMKFRKLPDTSREEVGLATACVNEISPNGAELQYELESLETDLKGIESDISKLVKAGKKR